MLPVSLPRNEHRTPATSNIPPNTPARAIFAVTAVLALAAFLFAARLLPEEKAQAVAWRDLSSQVGTLTILRSEHRVFREQPKLAKYLEAAHAKRPAPPVDFSKRQLLLVSPGPRSGTGYSVEVLSAQERGERITVRVRERSPRLGEEVRPRVTYPYRLLSLPAGKDVYVDWAGR
jgi:protease stability complex PrcB-like protein